MNASDAERILIRECGRMAPLFDRYSVTSSKAVWDTLRPFLPSLSEQRVLDLGCGPGAHAVRLASVVGDSGSVVGVDAARGMVEFARQRRGATVRKNVRFEQMDNRNLQFHDRSFDFVLSTFGLASRARERAVREAFRVLDNGGQFLCVSWGKANPEGRAFVDALNGLRRESPPPADVLKLSRARQLIADLPENRPGRDRHPLLTQLRKAGFDAVRVRRKNLTVHFSSITAYVHYKSAWGEYHRDLQRLTRAERRRFAVGIARRLGWRPNASGHDVTWELSFISARKR